MFLKLIIFTHIIAATIWTGGHLILSLSFLPKALKKNDFTIIEEFETKFERIGIPALLILVISGIYMAIVPTVRAVAHSHSVGCSLLSLRASWPMCLHSLTLLVSCLAFSRRQ